MGIDLLRQHNNSNYAPFVKKRTSPVIATLLSAICPGLGAAYNGQTTKALVYFAVFVGLFQLAVLTSGTPIFVFGFIGMWFFSALDAWRTAQMIRSGVTPDTAEDILVSRFSGNPKLWGIVLGVLGVAFLFQRVFNLGFMLRALLPIFLIGLGIYVLRGYIFKPKPAADRWRTYDSGSPAFVTAMAERRFDHQDYDPQSGYSDRSRSGAWRDR
jgi:hypothetical protein